MAPLLFLFGCPILKVTFFSIGRILTKPSLTSVGSDIILTEKFNFKNI